MEIQWHSTPPFHNHRDGFRESSIGLVWRLLVVLSVNQVITDEALGSCLTEAELSLNNRPLVPVSSEAKEQQPLTHNSLALHRDIKGLPLDCSTEGKYSCRRKLFKYLANTRRRRLKEYLKAPRPEQKWLTKKGNLKIQVVMVAERTTNRDQWPLGMIGDFQVDTGVLF